MRHCKRLKIGLLFSGLIGLCLNLNAATLEVTSPANDGNGTLRMAVANAASGDTIRILVTDEPLQVSTPIFIAKSLTIEGAASSLAHRIEATAANRIFQTGRRINVTLKDLTLAYGFSDGDGGAILSYADLLLQSVIIEASSAGNQGGAICQVAGSLSVINCHFANNSSQSKGGAISARSSQVSVRASAFTGNSSLLGGALSIEQGTADVLNSTFAENLATQAGGAVAMTRSEITAVNITFVDNSAPAGAHVHVDGTSFFELGNSIVGATEGPDSIGGGGTLTSSGANLFSAPVNWQSGTDSVNSDPELSGPGYFGGISPTYALRPGSPAIDAGLNSIATGTDQRGLSRFSNGLNLPGQATVDIGAFEAQAYPVSTLEIDTSLPQASSEKGQGNVFAKLVEPIQVNLKDAVEANNTAGGGVIYFDEAILPGRIELVNEALTIRRDLTIYGPGADSLVIDGSASTPVFRVTDGASAYLYGLGIEKGFSEAGGGIIVEGNAVLDLEAVALRDNEATLAGGGLALIDGSLTLFRSSLTDNASGFEGGAIFTAPGTQLTLDNSTLGQNYAAVRGGALAAGGPVSIDSSAFIDNSAGENAFGVFLYGASTTFSRNSLFSHSTVPSIVAGEAAAFSSLGNNLSDGIEPLLLGSNDQSGLADLFLAPLSQNTEGTFAYPLLATSPAIDSGSTASTTSIDQAGQTRLRGVQVDVGPIEFPNGIPLINCQLPVAYPAFCESAGGTPVSLPVQVSDPDGDALTIVWRVAGASGDLLGQATLATGTLSEQTIAIESAFPVGETLITVEVADALSSSTCQMSVLVVDNTPPVVVADDIVVPTESTTCGALVDFAVTAIDECSGIAAITYSDASASDLSSPRFFPVGESLINYTVVDGAGNSTSGNFTVSVLDETPPAISSLPDGLEIITAPGTCSAPVDFAAIITDGCSEGLEINYTVNGTAALPGDSFAVGAYSVEVTATDNSGNVATAQYAFAVVDATPPVFDTPTPADIEVHTDPGSCFAELSFTGTATDACSGQVEVLFEILNESDEWEAIEAPHRFAVGDALVRRVAVDDSGNSVAESFLVTVTDDVFFNCETNVAWPLALNLDSRFESAGGSSSKQVSIPQYLTNINQARWFKFSIEPGSRVSIILSGLPANYDLVVYKDIEAEYERLFNLMNSDDPADQQLALLGVEFAPESFSPESFSPESFSPESFSPESFSPESFSPESFSPESFSPESFSPESFSPESFSPESFSPESFSPESFSPDTFAPESFSPESFSPESFSPESFSPESFSPESFSAAQMSSIIGFSAFAGTANEGLVINTFDRIGNFYIRVKGANGVFSTETPFTLTVQKESEICEGLQGPDSPWFSNVQPVGQAGNYRSLILWDPQRMLMDGSTQSEVDALEARLNDPAFLNRSDVTGVVIDLGSQARVQDAHDQADLPEFQSCPFAKNLVADEIKAVIDAWWEVNPDLQNIVLIGNDEVIPFFRRTDQAFLANESNYVPPVIDSTHSQASLRNGQILTQDPYGSSCLLSLSTGPYPFPSLAVGRLVESAADAAYQIDNYMDTTDGVISSPTTALVTGYDFLWDVALEVVDELNAAVGPGGVVNSLIDDEEVAPVDGWTATELSQTLFNDRHELIFLAGHFSTGSSLAADYDTRFTAAEMIAEAPADHFLNTVVYSVGCHSGYNTVDAHAISGITSQPDWAQAFSKLGAILIAGTGYQYGDTEFVEYGERLYLEFTRNLRRGTGPVSVGEALRQAKITYLNETPLMRGIHEKSLLQATLYGLPMVKVDVPGERLGTVELGQALPLNLTAASSVQGTFYGLETADASIQPDFSELQVLTMRNIDVEDPEDPAAFIDTFWYAAGNGFVTSPAEPVRPLETFQVGQPGTLLRGVGFKGGTYTDINSVGAKPYIPLTGAPTTEIRGIFGNFFSEVFYPVQPYSTNSVPAICSGNGSDTLFNLYPSQYLATGGGALGGTLRKFDSMDFRFYYSDNRDKLVLSTGDEIFPALAPAPSIAEVKAGVVGSNVEFAVRVVALPAVGIDEVWVTYTGIEGSVFHGEWTSIDLAQLNPEGDSTLWSGTLPLPLDPGGFPIDPSDIRFIVQAASGIGKVALKTNFGEFYRIGIDESTTRIPTIIELESRPASGAYDEAIELEATLLDSEGAPATSENGGGLRVDFRVGPSQISGFTDPATGKVAISLPLNFIPGPTTLKVSFLGDSVYEPTSTSSPFLLERQSTQLAFEGPLPAFVQGGDIAVRLTDAPSSGQATPLKERTVFFLVEYGPDQGNQVLGTAVITDFTGRADLSGLDLIPGSARITAFFNGPIQLPDGTTTTMDDELYSPAIPVSIDVTVEGEVATGPSLIIEPNWVDVNYDRPWNFGFLNLPRYYEDLTVRGTVAFRKGFSPEEFLALNGGNPELIDATVEAWLAGEKIASQVLQLGTLERDGLLWRNEFTPNAEVQFVSLRWSENPRFDTALGNSAGPRIYTDTRSIWFGTILRFSPSPGTYTTTFPDGTVVPVVDGVVQTPVASGLSFPIFYFDGDELVYIIRTNLIPDSGQAFVTEFATSSGGGTVVAQVATGQNFIDESANLIVRLSAQSATPRPSPDSEPNTLELRLILGNEGQEQAEGHFLIGEAPDALPWSFERNDLKRYLP